MRILFLTTQFPYPLDNGGKIGAFNGISVVSKKHDVVVLSFSEEPQYIDEGINYFKEKLPTVKFERPIYQDIHIRNKPVKLIKVMCNNYLRGIPYVTAKFENLAMYKKIDDLCTDKKWDVIFIDYLNMNIYADYIRRKHTDSFRSMVLKDHNLEYEIVKQASENGCLLKKLILELEWRRTLKYEVNAIKKAHLVFSVCEENTEFMKQYNANAHTMLPTYDIEEITYIDKTQKNILFMGNLSWGANMEGIKWFVEYVLPLITKKIPEVILTIIGSGPAENPFINYTNINYRGYVKDIEGIYNEHSVFVVPLFEGSGIRIKILDAFNNGIAVVSTNLGCKTIGAVHNREILIADDENKFAEEVIRLLENPEFNYQIVENARYLLETKFSLDSRQKEFEKLIKETIIELENR